MAHQSVNTKKVSSISRPASPEKTTRLPDVWSSLRSELDTTLDRFSNAFGMPSFRKMFDLPNSRQPDGAFSFAVPAVDVSENDKAYHRSAEVPSMDSNEIEVTVNGDMLTIKGEKRQKKEEKGENFYMCERSFGAFQRSFSLPSGIDRDRISSELRQGILMITLPKTDQARQQQKKIQVKST